MDLTPKQAALLQRMLSSDFELIAFPVYPNHIGIRRGNCAALLVPAVPETLKIFAEPAYLVDGSLSARITLDGHDYFIWKKQKLEATPARRAELVSFADDLAEALLPVESIRIAGPMKARGKSFGVLKRAGRGVLRRLFAKPPETR
jgi:hypothetical protein